LDGAVERLFPGYARFESSLDGRVMTERKQLRSALEREKIRVLEQYVREGRAKLAEPAAATQLTDPTQRITVAVEAALLDADHLAAVKLALKTKRLPLTADDVAVRNDQGRPFFERFSTGLSEVPLERYYEPYVSECDFTRETVRTTEFLIAHRRVFKEHSEVGINDPDRVDQFAQLCQNEHLLRSLFVFTCADRAEWESEKEDPVRWFNTRELYFKAMTRFKPAADPTQALKAAGYSQEELSVLKDFGADFFGGVYRQYANRFGAHLARLAMNHGFSDPKVSIIREGTSRIVAVAARDYRGLAAAISGALWHCAIELRQAHLFSAMNHGLAFDFFHVAPSEKPLPPDLNRTIEDVIKRRLHIADADEGGLPQIVGAITLHEWRPGLYRLHFETSRNAPGIIYSLTYKVFRYLRGNIFGLSAHVSRGMAYVSVYHSLPPDLPLPEAQNIAQRFCRD
jgi:hypothetical protein